MAKSRTRKKSAEQIEAEKFMGAVTSYLRHWTLREIEHIQRQEHRPVCIPTKTGYRIGLYRLTINSNRTCTLTDINGDHIHTFDNRINAVLYTIYLIKGNYRRSDEILALDREINKCYTDVVNLRRAVTVLARRQDYDSSDVRQMRLELAEQQLETARNKISKIHNTAKYYKIWD
jgi:hypothetical protein